VAAPDAGTLAAQGRAVDTLCAGRIVADGGALSPEVREAWARAVHLDMGLKAVPDWYRRDRAEKRLPTLGAADEEGALREYRSACAGGVVLACERAEALEAFLERARNAERPAPKGPADGGADLRMGSLDKEAIRGVIQQEMGKVRACYERTLECGQNLQGTMKVFFTIGPEGQVVKAWTTSLSVAEGEGLAACIVGVVRGYRFPAPRGGGNVQVHYPFNFRNAP
jgi:hypothetical protein